MTGDTYFSKFPTIAYANNTVRNISERVTILHGKIINPDSFYPVALQGTSTRPDIVANSLYGDAFRDWLLWLNNNAVDPYYNWYLSDDEFNAMILDKYGSVPFAEAHIEYWRTAWPLDLTQSRIPTAFYQTGLPASWQKYFQPYVDPNSNEILYYQAGYYDWRTSSNQMVSYNLSGGNVFAVGNVVQFTSGPNVVGQAQVVECNTSLLVVQHSVNNVTGTPLGVLDMFDASTVGTVTSANTLVQIIPTTEIVFWEPVSSYTMEEEFNAYRRFIQVIDGSQAMQVSTIMNQLLRS